MILSHSGKDEKTYPCLFTLCKSNKPNRSKTYDKSYYTNNKGLGIRVRYFPEI